MRVLARVALAVGLLAVPGLAVADDDAVVTPPPATPPPATPPPTAPPPTAAEPAPPPPAPVRVKRTTVGVDLSLVLPVGDYADGNDLGVGGLLRIAYAATPEVGITLRFGYVWHKTESASAGLGMVPVLIGGVYKFERGAFAYGELGINLIRVSTEFMNLTATDAETYFSIGAGGGYAVGKVQARLGLWMPGRRSDMAGTHTLIGVVGGVGFDFNAF